jgi:hypothetical protein
MATLRVRDLKIGGVYREPLSGYLVRVREFHRKDAMGNPIRAEVMYHNPISGLHVVCEVFDRELEEVAEVLRPQPPNR